MNKKRFASHLLTGKIAAMPFMVNNSFAAVPTYTEILSETVSVIETPATGVKLMTTTKSASSGGDAIVCSSPTTFPKTINVVITGAHPGNIVYLAASTNKDDASFLSIHPNLRVGSENFSIISSFVLGNSPIQEDAGNFSQSTSPISIPVDVVKLVQKNLLNTNTSKFYLQAVIFSTTDAATMWSTARLSELDEIVASTQACSSSSYGGY